MAGTLTDSAISLSSTHTHTPTPTCNPSVDPSTIAVVDVSKQAALTQHLCYTDPISYSSLTRISSYDPELVDMMQFMKYAYRDTGYVGTVAFQLKYHDGQQRTCYIRIERSQHTSPYVVIFDDIPPDNNISATVTMPRDVFFGVYLGTIAPQNAYLAGTLQVPFLSFREVANFANSFDSSSTKWKHFYEMRDTLDSTNLPPPLSTSASSSSIASSLSNMLMNLSLSSDASHMRTLDALPLNSPMPMLFPSPIYSYLLHSDQLGTPRLTMKTTSIVSLLSHSSGYPLPWLTPTPRPSLPAPSEEDELIDSVSFSLTACPVHDMMITSHRPLVQHHINQQYQLRHVHHMKDTWHTDIHVLVKQAAPHEITPPSLFTPSLSLTSRFHHTVRTHPSLSRSTATGSIIPPSSPTSSSYEHPVLIKGKHAVPIASAITIVKQHARKSKAVQLWKTKVQLLRRDSSELYHSTSRTVARALEATRHHFRQHLQTNKSLRNNDQ